MVAKQETSCARAITPELTKVGAILPTQPAGERNSTEGIAVPDKPEKPAILGEWEKVQEGWDALRRATGAIPPLSPQNFNTTLPDSMPVAGPSDAWPEGSKASPVAYWLNRRVRERELSAEKNGVAEAATKHTTKTDPETFAILLTAYGAVFGAGLLQIAARDWYFGPIFTVGGGLGLMSILPFVRPKLQVMRSTRVLWAMVAMAWLFLGANLGFAVYDHFWPAQREATETVPVLPERWPALTKTKTADLAERVQSVPPEDIVVACGTINCRDLADEIADILLKTEGWKVSVLHRGGLDISGVTGIQLNPNEPATQALRQAIESATKLKVTIGPDTRKDVGSNQSFLTVGTRPF